MDLYDRFGEGLRRVINESREEGRIIPYFNSKFIYLILKVDNPSTFEDFRLIYLCNCIYKIIVKVIALRIKPILSNVISCEQFWFLDGRKIHEAKDSARRIVQY